MRARFVSPALLASCLCVLPGIGCSPSGEEGLRQAPPAPEAPAGPHTLTAPPAPRPLPQPPAISGGTLFVLRDGSTAVAADPDRDLVWIVDLVTGTVRGQVFLEPGDEPGRGVEDAAGRVHVALRGGGALVSIDPSQGTVLSRRPACQVPRGLAYDAASDVLHVACADGALVTFPAAGGDAVRKVALDRDLRDVVVQGDKLYVSLFRAAQILELDAAGAVTQRITLPAAPGHGFVPTTFTASVAWRMVGLADGGLMVLHQRAQVEPVSPQPNGYVTLSGPCASAGLVQDALTIVRPGSAPGLAPSLAETTLAVDLAVSPDGSQIAVAAPGNIDEDPVGIFALDAIDSTNTCALSNAVDTPGDVATSVAYDGHGHLIVQTRDPATLLVTAGGSPTVVIALPGERMSNDGLTLFHATSGAGIACASCHPEGGDDGKVWSFDGLGPRRTQNLRGGVLARAPFHWDGSLADMAALVSDVLVGRMQGEQPSEADVVSLGRWLDGQPALPAPVPADPAAVDRGSSIFHSSRAGCTGCHNGPELSDHLLADVGTAVEEGRSTFKTPSLVSVAYRAPFLHDGCAATLVDRFVDTACGGGDAHGVTSQLTEAELADLIAFLESL